jgi:3-hydroxyisobutyrate dehydrogenase-like beta-hydroxyacid dehydrogenase
MATLGFVGLGAMGGPMASHLARSGHDVVVFDREPERIGGVEAVGARGARSTPDVGQSADVVFLSLPGPEAVVTVASELESTLRAGSVVVDTTTSTPETTRAIADRLNRGDVTVLGAPVSGGTSGAADGALTTMVGGDRSAFEACKPYL